MHLKEAGLPLELTGRLAARNALIASKRRSRENGSIRSVRIGACPHLSRLFAQLYKTRLYIRHCFLTVLHPPCFVPGQS
jgi:hypothetical protein